MNMHLRAYDFYCSVYLCVCELAVSESVVLLLNVTFFISVQATVSLSLFLRHYIYSHIYECVWRKQRSDNTN